MLRKVNRQKLSWLFVTDSNKKDATKSAVEALTFSTAAKIFKLNTHRLLSKVP